ncbi:MAG TPA: DUF1361 domain-containing protein [Candidatus Angelobacter sp.]|nr:DUF1361 domain-containing protein [Candidatus Angelobacter sp.]
MSHQPAYFNLVWNLFLAWLPLGFAFVAGAFRPPRGRFVLWAFLWLLFLPNSPYLVTDLVHLKPRPPVPLWFDILLVQSFVLTGLLLGFLSLHLMHRRVSHSFGWRSGWLFTLVVLGLTAFGIYLGRFERWNSWDLFLRPIGLLSNVADVLLHPRTHKAAVVFSFLCAVLLFVSYFALYVVTALDRLGWSMSPKVTAQGLQANLDELRLKRGLQSD